MSNIKEDISTIAFICYASFFTILLLLISIITYEKDEKTKTWLHKIWEMRGIYAPILTHIYDTATDIGVLILWAQLAIEDSVDHVDMMGLFILGCVFLSIYRLIAIVLSVAVDDNSWLSSIVLGLTDLAIFSHVYKAFKDNAEEKPTEMFYYQLFESVSESVPQMTLQVFFLIRTSNSSSLNILDVLLLGLSIFGSLLSITTKIIEIDSDQNNIPKHNFTCSKTKRDENGQCCCVRVGYIVRCLFRLSQVCLTMCIYSMIWAIMGGWFLAIYMAWIIIVNAILIFCVYHEDFDVNNIFFRWLISFVFFIDDKQLYQQFLRMIEHILFMFCITAFGVFKFDCDIFCADPNNRNIFQNNFSFAFVTLAWFSLIVYLICFFIVRKQQWVNLTTEY